MLTLKDYVNWGITHSDKTGSAEGVPLVMGKCVKNKKMKQFEVYGNSIQNGTPSPENPIEVESVGELVTDVNDANCGKYKIPVTVRGKNLFDKDNSVDLYDGNSNITQIPTDTGVKFSTPPNNGGGYVHLDLGVVSLYAGKTITATMKAPIVDSEAYGTTRFVVCNSNGSDRIQKGQTTVVKENGIAYITMTYDVEDIADKHLTMRLYVASGTPSTTYEFNEIMVSESNIPIPFEPYVESQTTNVYLNEPLRKIGDYADYIDFKGRKVVRNTLKRIYDGVHDANNPLNMVDNETSWNVADSGSFWLCTLNDVLPVIPKNGYADFTQIPKCLQLPVKTGKFVDSSSPATVDKELIWYCDLGRNVRLFLAKDRFDGTAAGLRSAYLQANPITVYCAIYEPYEEPITCELPILPAKTSIVEINTSILPSNIKGKYIKR